MLAALSVLLTFIPLVLAVNVPTLASGWEYVGCLYEGEGQRILNWTIYPSSGMTPAVCVTYCNNQGLPFAGLADADQCMCGSKLSNFQRVDERNCNSTCAGNAQYECGGWGYISFYSLASKNPDPDATSSTTVTTSSAKAVQTSTVVTSAAAGTTTVKEEAQTQTVVVTSVATDGEASGQVVTLTMVVSSTETTSEAVSVAEVSTALTSSSAETPSASSQDPSLATSSATGGPTFSSASPPSSSSLSTTSASFTSDLLPTYHASSTLFPSATPRLKTPSVIFGLVEWSNAGALKAITGS
ncbi:hypothetical protein L198_06724 [Cryptococcus wingfieldii CBS 7118]|uniref:WSC domain-containing protein n=1 Tax=Cryptococcus wingfieldii CBS 7118 TaxID=1295528 RepID=A0A1E3IIM9_9TREE|nr:hypothetical protein L198_06724 [Cryptococcus wingfieldii CBS 7118]ODN88452.1 hypothetical protein L198_06724 [Cryptococcus wingfieldii CBS 7118]